MGHATPEAQMPCRTWPAGWAIPMREHWLRGWQRVFHLLAGAQAAALPVVEAGAGLVPIEVIRQSLLECLEELGGARYPAVERRIWLENDVAGLWHLRSDVMVALSDLYGEVAALEKIRQVTPLFAGHVPLAHSAIGASRIHSHR